MLRSKALVQRSGGALGVCASACVGKCGCRYKIDAEIEGACAEVKSTRCHWRRVKGGERSAENGRMRRVRRCMCG